MSNNRGCGVVKEIVKIIRVNDGKKIEWKFGFKNKLIIFSYYLNLFLTLTQIIKLFYQTYLTHT